MGPPPHEPPTCRCDECDLVMDFDDMPDSYFAFLSNQRKLTDTDLAGAARSFESAAGTGVGGESSSSSSKVKSRASQPNMGGPRQSVPSLPSIQRVGAMPSGPQMVQQVASGAVSQRNVSKPPSRPLSNGFGASSGSPSRPGGLSTGNPSYSSQFQMQPGAPMVPVATPPKGNALVFVLIAILVAAIGVLAYLVLTKN